VVYIASRDIVLVTQSDRSIYITSLDVTGMILVPSKLECAVNNKA